MSDLPYDNQERLVEVLQATYTGNDENIRQATEILQQMSTNPARFSDSLTRIINSDKSDEETLKIKNSASVVLSRFILDLMKTNKLDTESRNYIIRSTISSMYSDFVPLPMKVNLQFFLLLLYTVDIGSPMINEGFQVVKERLNSNNVNHYPPSFLILQAIINTVQAPQESVAKWFEELAEPLVKIGGGLVHGVIMEIQGLAQGNQQADKATNILIGLKILKMWILTIHEFIKLLSTSNSQTGATPMHLQVVVVCEPIVQVLSAILTLSITTDRQIKDSLISTSGIPELDQLLNTIKTNILKAFSKVIDAMKDSTVALNAATNKFFAFSRALGVPLILNSLITYCRNENVNLEEALSDRDISEHISESLSFLIKMLNYPDLHPMYAGVIKHLAVDVCFPLIKTTKKDIALFNNEPDQFVTLSLDTCGTQSSQTPKTQAAKLLDKLCTQIDGGLSYVVLIILCMVDYSMVSDKREDIQTTYKDLAEHANSVFIAKTDPTTRVETCLLLLAILNGPIGKRKDLINMIEQLFKTYQEFFLGEKSSPVIKARVCLLISYYAHTLFQGDEKKELYALHLRFVLECIGIEQPGYATVVEQASYSLYTMFEREYLVSTLEQFVPDLLGRLEAYIPTTKVSKVFDIVYEIVTSYEYKLLDHPDQLISLVNTLVKRGEQEFEIIRQNRTAKKIILNKVWNIIRGIAEQEDYVVALQEDIEKALIPMFRYLDINIDIDFDEDILNYVASVTKITKKVSPTIWEIFRTFPKTFEKHQGMLSNLFPSINHIIVYGSGVINQDASIIQVLIEMGIQALNPTHQAADEANFSEGALLLQLVFQYLEPIAPDLFEKILRASFDKLRTAEKDYLKARLAGVFLCAFLKNFELTQIILNSMNATTFLMDLFLKNVLVFEGHSYDRKLLVIGVSSLLVQPNLSPEISSRLLEIFDVSISLLRYVGFMEQYEAKKNYAYDEDDSDEEEEHKTSNQSVLMQFLDNKEKLTANLDEDELEEHKDDDDDDEDDEDGGSFLIGKAEANSVVKNLETELKQRDEFAIFKQAVLQMKENNYTTLSELVNKLPEKKRDFLRDVLQSQRVDLGPDGRSQARKIVKARAKKVANIQLQDGVNPNNQFQQQ